MEEDIDTSHCHGEKQQEVSYNYTNPPNLQMITIVRQGVNTLEPRLSVPDFVSHLSRQNLEWKV